MTESTLQNRHYRLLFKAIPEPALIVSAVGVILDANLEACNVLGYEREELLGRNFSVLLGPSDPRSEDIFARLRAKKCRPNLYLWSRDGVPLVAEVSLTGLAKEGGDGPLAIVFNVSEDVRETPDLYTQLNQVLENGRDLIILCDAEGNVSYVSPSVEYVLGFRQEMLVGKSVFDQVHPEDRERIVTAFTKNLSDAGATTFAEFRIQHADGSWHYLESTALNLLDGLDVKALVVNARDITERKLGWEALNQSEERYRTVVQQATESIFVVDIQTKRLLEANAAFHDSLGYAPAELEFLTLYDIVVSDRPNVDRIIEYVLEKGQYFIGERNCLHNDGSLMDFEMNAGTIVYGGKEALCIVARDLTEPKQTEENLRRSLGVLLALREAGQILGSTLESDEIITRLLKIMRGVSGLTAAVISVEDEYGNPRIWRAVGLEGLWRRARYAPEADDARQVVLKTGNHQLFRLRRPDSETEHLVGLCLPLRMRNRIAGVLEAYGPESLAEMDSLEILRSLAAQAASALENATLYGELAEREKRLAELVGQLFAAQEEERRRVAYEVHDGLAQVAAAGYQHLQAFAEFYPPHSEEGRELLDQALNLVQRTVGDARRVIADLRPTVLDDFGLQTAIRIEVQELRGSGWQVDYRENMNEDERLPVAVETALFRITQEALTNIRKHADTKQVRLSLGRLGNNIRLRVRDWGEGFDPANPSNDGGPGERVGLSSMSERVGLLGGYFYVHSRHSVGTLITVEIPLPEQAGSQREELARRTDGSPELGSFFRR